MKGCILECGGVAPKQWFLHCQLLQQTDKDQQETKQLRHTKIQRLKAVEFARTCQTTLNIVNSMNKILHSGVRQATTSMMPTRIDPRMKRKSFLVDRLVCFLFGESNHRKKNKTRGIKMAILVSIKISGPSSVLEFMELNPFLLKTCS